MAQAAHQARILFSSDLTLSEGELRALSTLFAVGPIALLKLLPEAERDRLAPYVDRLVAAVKEQVDPAIGDIDKARRDLADAAKRRAQPVAASTSLTPQGYYDYGNFWDGWGEAG